MKVRAGRLLALLVALNLVNYLDRYVPAAVLPLIERDLGLSHARSGLLGTAFVLVYALASPAAGWLGDRRSRTRLAGAGALVFGLACFGSGLAPGFLLLLLARALTGAGEAGYATVTPSILSDLYPEARRGWALSIFYAALPVGSALGYLPGGFAGAGWGWRQAFAIAGLPALALGAALLLVRDPERGAMDAPAPAGGPRHGLGLLLRRKSFLANNVGQIFLTFGLGGIAFWMPSYLHHVRGLDLERAGALFGGVLAAAGFLGTIGGGALSARLQRRGGADFLVSGASMALSAPFAVAAVLLPWPWAYWTALFLAAALAFANTGPLNAAIVNVVPADLRATAIAWNVLLIHLFGDALSPFLLGALADAFGLRASVLSVSVVLAAGGLWLLGTARLLVADLRPGSPRA